MRNAVEEYYDGQAEAEWNRLTRHRLEFEITRRALEEYIAPGSRVLDVGGGPGRYSIHLTKMGCSVTLLDLSSANISKALSEAERAGVSLEAAVHGNALDLENTFAGQLFDAVLCMGPLYHLHKKTDRVGVVSQCMGLIRPGGIFAAAFISAYAPILDLMRNYPEKIEGAAARYLNYLSDGRNYASEGFTDAWFEHPKGIDRFMAEFPLEKIALLAAEGMGILAESALTVLPEEQFQQWAGLLYAIAGNPELHGACEHLLYVGRKKRSSP